MSSKINTQGTYCSAMKLEPEGSQNKPEPETEHSTIPTGLLVIRKSPDICIQNEIGKIFKGHNLLEYKFSGNDMDIETFLQPFGYAFLYLAYADNYENIRDDITVSLVREKKPKKLFRQLSRKGFVVKEDGKGIYQIQGLHFFTVQVIVSSELNEKEHIWLNSLTRAMEEENAERLILTIGD